MALLQPGSLVEKMIKEGMMGYGLDVAISHYYGANAAHFFPVMLAYNLMNWFKEGISGQRKVKRMARWVRERFFCIPGLTIGGAFTFIQCPQTPLRHFVDSTNDFLTFTWLATGNSATPLSGPPSEYYFVIRQGGYELRLGVRTTLRHLLATEIRTIGRIIHSVISKSLGRATHQPKVQVSK